MKTSEEVITNAEELRWQLPQNLHDRIAESIYGEAAGIADRNITRREGSRRLVWQQNLDRVLTNPWTAFPVMIMVLGAILWITITGANVPSSMLATLLVDQGHTWFSGLLVSVGSPEWLRGLLADGMYLATAWVIAVMLPPMAIFFPCFTLLEDFGFLPRVAFNLDRSDPGLLRHFLSSRPERPKVAEWRDPASSPRQSQLSITAGIPRLRSG